MKTTFTAPSLRPYVVLVLAKATIGTNLKLHEFENCWGSETGNLVNEFCNFEVSLFTPGSTLSWIYFTGFGHSNHHFRAEEKLY